MTTKPGTVLAGMRARMMIELTHPPKQHNNIHISMCVTNNMILYLLSDKTLYDGLVCLFGPEEDHVTEHKRITFVGSARLTTCFLSILYIHLLKQTQNPYVNSPLVIQDMALSNSSIF